MGDYRADIKITVDFFGNKYKMDSYINYCPDFGAEFDGVDQRVIDFFRNSWEDAKRKHDEAAAKYHEIEREAKTKENELAELERLKKKYES